MNRNKTNLFLLVIFVWCSLITVEIYAQSKENDEELDLFFKKYTEAREKIQVLKATFVQKNIYPDEIYTSKGTVIFVKPQRIVFTMDEPKKFTVVEEKRVYEYEPDIKQVTIYDLKDSDDTEIFFFAFAEDLNTLRKKYHVVPIRLSDERGKHGVAIRPFSDKEEGAPFEEIVLYLQDETFLPYRLRIVNEDNVQTVVDFEQVEINGKIRVEDTQIFVPAGTTIIENDRFKETVSGEGKRIPEPAKLDSQYIDTSSKQNEEKKDKKENSSTEENSSGIQDKSHQIEVRDLEPLPR